MNPFAAPAFANGAGGAAMTAAAAAAGGPNNAAALGVHMAMPHAPSRSAYVHRMAYTDIGFAAMPAPVAVGGAEDARLLGAAVPDFDFKLEESILQQLEALRTGLRAKDDDLNRKLKARNERHAREWKVESDRAAAAKKEAEERQMKAKLAAAAAAAQAASEPPPPAYGSGISVLGSPPPHGHRLSHGGPPPVLDDAMDDSNPGAPGGGGGGGGGAAAAVVVQPAPAPAPAPAPNPYAAPVPVVVPPYGAHQMSDSGLLTPAGAPVSMSAYQAARAGGAGGPALAVAVAAKPQVVVAVPAAASQTPEQLMVASLTEYQRELLASFKGIASGANDVGCIRLLTAMSWNLNRSIESYFQYGENIELAISKAPKPSSQAAAAASAAQGPVPVALPVAGPAGAAAAAGRGVAYALPAGAAGAGAAVGGQPAMAIPVSGGGAGASSAYAANAYAYPALGVRAGSASAAPAGAAAVAGQKTLLTIVLPDNSVLTREFLADDTLWTVWEYVASSAPKYQAQVWTLQATYPERKYYPEDALNQTLRQAKLVPSANMRACLGNFR